MSHITKVDLQIKDLTALQAAAKRLGLEFAAATEHRYFGNKMNPCEYKLSIKDNPIAYEIGVARAEDGTYALSYDAWGGGNGMMAIVSTDGKNLNKIKQAYGVELAKSHLRKQGHRITERVRPDGSIEIQAAIAG